MKHITDKEVKEIEKVIEDNKLEDKNAEWNEVQWGTYDNVMEYLEKEKIAYDYDINHCFDSPGMDIQTVVFAFIKDNKPYLISFTEYAY